MLIFGDVKKTLKQASSGGCTDDDVIERINEAIPLLMGKLYFVGTVGEIKIQTFVPEFSLPFGFERALSIEQCEAGDFHQGWYTIENAGAYIDPALWGDAVLIDLGSRATERPLLGAAQIIVQSDYNEDAGLTLTIAGSLEGQPQYTSFQKDGRFLPRDYEILAIGPESSDSSMSVNNYDAITSIRKPVTRGPVRILAKDANSGRIYRIVTLQPNETDVARRWYKYPELVLQKIIPRCVYPTDIGFQIDTNFEQVPLCVGDSIVLSGFCPTQFNGLWTVAAMEGSSFYVTAPAKIDWTNPGDLIPKIGCCTKLACALVSASKQFVPIVDDKSEVLIQNRLALRMTVRALWEWDKGNVDGPQGYTTLLKEAVAMLTDDVTRYGEDPTNTLSRKAAYKWETEAFAPSTFGYIRARLALEIPNGLRIGRSDWGRLVNEAQELSIVKGKYGNTTATRRYQVSDCNKIVLDPDAESILAFSINGRPGVVGDKYWKAVTRQNIGTRNSSFVGGPFFAMSSLAGASTIEPTAVPLDQEERDEHDRCCHAYEIHPCGTWFRCCVEATVKLRYLPAKCLTDHLLITNYSAIKTIVEALIKKDNSDFGAYSALKNDGFQTLDVEMRHKKGGAAGKMRKGSWATTRFSQGQR